MPINEIQEFAATGTVENGDVMLAEAYAADPHRARGHQVGIGRRELENTVLRQLSRFSRGLAQFIAERYVPGVVDDGDEAKIVEGMAFAISEMIAGHNESGTAHADIRAALAGISIPAASETVAGIIKQATAAQAMAGTDNTTAMSPADVAAAIAGVVRGYTRQQYPVPVSRGSVSGAQAMDLDLHQELWMTAAGAITFSNPTNMVSGKWVTLRIYAASAQTIGWGNVWCGTSLVALPTVIDAWKTLHLSFVCMSAATMQLMGAVQGA